MLSMIGGIVVFSLVLTFLTFAFLAVSDVISNRKPLSKLLEELEDDEDDGDYDDFDVFPTFFDNVTLDLETLEIPDDYEEVLVDGALQVLGDTVFIKYSDIVIADDTVWVVIDGHMVACATMKTGKKKRKLKWKNSTPEVLRTTVRKLIYACNTIMAAKLNGANKAVLENTANIEVTDYQGVSVTRTIPKKKQAT